MVKLFTVAGTSANSKSSWVYLPWHAGSHKYPSSETAAFRIQCICHRPSQDHLALSPQHRHCGLRRKFRTDPHFGLVQVSEFEEFRIIVYDLLVFETAVMPVLFGNFRMFSVTLEVQGIAFPVRIR